MILLSQIEVIMLIFAVIAVFYIGYIIGGFDRRLPKETTITDGWWQEDGQRNND